MKFHTLRRRQWIPRGIDEVFGFFSDARNLEAITPPWLGFHVLTPGIIHIEEGTRISYRIGLHGVPLRWTTEIRRWQPPHRFVDIQLSGPYRLWHHTHRFRAGEGGTYMDDLVRYRLPFGFLGRVVNRVKVKSDVERIFDYRRQQIELMWK